MSERRPAASAPLDGAAFALLALAVVGWLAPRVAGFTTDSDAYLDVARGVREGAGLVQSVVDFWRPGVPDPLGLWPPLYPLLVAVVSAFGVPLDLAARFVSAGSFAVFAFAFHALAVAALGRGGAALATVAALATLSVTRLGAFAWSEATYLAFTASGLALLARAESAEGWTRGRALGAGLAFGLAAVTRHAGVPVALAAVAYVALRPALRGDGGLRAFALQALALPGVGIARNVLLFGRPFGPALPPAEHGIATQGFEFARALRWELLPAPFDRIEATSIALGAAVAVGVLLALRAGGASRLAAGFALGYAALVVVATGTSAINAPTGRYLAPVLPFLVLAAFAGWRGRGAADAANDADGGGRRALATGLAAVWTIAAVLELVGQGQAMRAPAPEVLARRDDLRALERLVPAGSTPVLSDCGHLVRTATGRAAVQVPAAGYRPRAYTAADDARWERAGVDQAIFAAGEPPAGAWERVAVEGRFTRWVRRAAED